MEWAGQSFCRFPAFAGVFVDGCRAIEETRKFPEHKCVEAYQFICYVLNTILSILAVVKTVMEIIDQDFDQNSSILISASVFLDVVVFYLAKSGPIVAWMGNRMLKMKIRDTIEECNARHLRGLGVEAVFPETSKRCCFCIRLPDICCKKKNYSRL